MGYVEYNKIVYLTIGGINMYCSNCGKEVTGNFCAHCGAKLVLVNESNVTEDMNIRERPAEIIAETKKGFWETAKEQAKLQAQKDLEKKREREARIQKLEEEGIAYCSKCLSTSLTANKKGFGIGKAIIGASINPIGLVAGNIGAKKVRVTCLKCGHQFWAGKK